MQRLQRRQSHKGGDENPYWISFSDLMSALLVIFVLAVVVLILQLGQQQQILKSQQEEFSRQVGTLQEAENVRAIMLEEIQKDLKASGIEVLVSENNSVISIPTKLLGFDKGAYDIKPENTKVSLAIGKAVAKAINVDDRTKYLDTVFVEGHTDNVQHSGLEGTGNWGLSTFRAIALWRLWDDQLKGTEQLSSLQSAEGKQLFSVSGYGETRPLSATQNTDAQREQNRRIDLRFTIVRPDAQDLKDIEVQFNGEE